MEYVIKEHKGRSGKSVFAFRVYSIHVRNGCHKQQIQLGKFKTRAAAEALLARYRVRAKQEA